MKFADVLASAIHDIKNSLGIVLNALDEVATDPALGLQRHPKIVALQLEARRTSNDLIQLLALYKFENQRLSPRIVEHNLEEFLEEVKIDSQVSAELRGIRMESDCDGFLSACFDEDLVRGVLINAIGNAERYTRDRIRISADTQDGYTLIRVEDNGIGFPETVLAPQSNQEPAEDFSHGRTRLGLHFATQIAQLHRNGNRRGRIGVDNDSSLGGGRFSIWLP